MDWRPGQARVRGGRLVESNFKEEAENDRSE